MPGILADVNILGEVRLIVELFQDESRREFWTHSAFATPTFAELGLHPRDADAVVWRKCQELQLILVTGNRNAHGADSLEATIRAHNVPSSLPVITLSDSKRVARDRNYAHRVADKILEYLFDLDKLRGTGRLYVP